MNLVTDATADRTAGVSKRVVDGRFVKMAVTPLEREFLRNEARILEHLTETRIAPAVYELEETESSTLLLTEYLGESQPVTDEVAFRRNCARLLITLRQAGVVHGDLTRYNIVVRDNFPIAVDFAQSRLVHEAGPDKRPEGDAFHLWEAARQLSPDTGRHIRKWQAIRPFVAEGSLIDLGCWEGDYTLFALSENPNRQIVGVEGNLHNYEMAECLWGRGLISYQYTRLVGKYRLSRQWDTAFLMSVWSYLVQDYGRPAAEEFLAHVIQHTGQLFFENQLYGDGPGPVFFAKDDGIYHLLKQYGRVEKLVTIPVHGRPFSRTVWRVT